MQAIKRKSDGVRVQRRRNHNFRLEEEEMQKIKTNISFCLMEAR